MFFLLSKQGFCHIIYTKIYTAYYTTKLLKKETVLNKFMKICGIICEFNPLHNGHEHLIQTAKKQYDYVLCLMSGNFTQRGKPACLDKFERAKLAISAGADIVIEFPTIFAVNGADEFAKHAIMPLNF